MESHKPKIPRLVTGVNVRALPLGPMEGFVLSRIDASATLGDIADLTSLDLEEVVRIIDKLLELGAVEWADGNVGYPRATPRTSAAPPRSSPNAALTRPPEPLQKNVTEVPRPHGPNDPAAQRTAVRVFAPPPPRAPQLDQLGASTPLAAPLAPTIPPPRGRVRENAGLHVERPKDEGPADSFPPSPFPGARPLTPPLEAASASSEATAPSVPPETKTMPDDGIDLSLERRKRIDDLYFALDLLDHYEVLSLPRRADKARIRSSYFAASKAFHPDTVFRKTVGTYRAKMEAIFSRLTEAYEVLGKKKARAEYDEYLASLGETRAAEEALSGEHEIPKELRDALAQEQEEAARSSEAHAPTPLPVSAEAERPVEEPPQPSKQSAPTEEGRRVAREVLQKRMDGMRSQSRPRPVPAPEPSPAPVLESTGATARSQREALRDLTSSLKGAAAMTGGVDQVTRYTAEARRAIDQGDVASAVRAYRHALSLSPERSDLVEEHARWAGELAVSLADRYETQAIYEERYRKWGSAATSWAKVIEGRPKDANAMTHAANALVEAKGDLHQARRFAQQATELVPNDAAARRALGRVFLAAGLTLNARRELEHAKTLDPSSEVTRLLLRELDARKT